MLERQIRLDTALAPDAERLDNGTKFASGRGQPIFEDARLRSRCFTRNDPGNLKILEALRQSGAD